MNSQQHPALSPFQAKGLSLKNRLVLAPMSRASALANGTPTKEMADYYAEFARGGFAMIITEGVYPDMEYGIGYAFQPGIVGENHVEGWKTISQAVKPHGAKLIMQLMHAGALSQYHSKTLAPSLVQPQGHTLRVYEGPEKYPNPSKALSKGEIKVIIAQFAEAARRAEEAGLDGVEVHAANGYLLDQFATPYTNLRDDEYGGSAQNRIRLTAETVSAIQSVVSESFIVGVRISQSKVNDKEYRWPGQEEARTFYQALEKAGADFLHIASEGNAFQDSSDLGGISTTQLAKQTISIPIIANGGMHDPALSARLIKQGETDLVSLARWALSNPDYPHKLANREAFRDFEVDMILPRATLKVAKQWFKANT